MEVTCTRNTQRANVLWNIEQVVDARRKSSDVQRCIFDVYGLVIVGIFASQISFIHIHLVICHKTLGFYDIVVKLAWNLIYTVSQKNVPPLNCL